MKRLISIILIITTLLCLTSCAELINTETQEVDATVVSVYHKNAWVQPVWTGKVMIMVSHPAKNEVTFQYENVTLTVNSQSLYNHYKDKIGATVKCDLITEYYDDGSTRQTLKLKED